MLALTSGGKLKYLTYSVAGPLSPVHAEHTCSHQNSGPAMITILGNVRPSEFVLIQCKSHHGVGSEHV
jgi:hypothetical protein